jgi:hypothetical protein
MSGRPLASYAYPQLWSHVAALGLIPSPRALIRLRWASTGKVVFLSQLSNRFFETKCNPERPALWDYNTAHDVAAMVQFHLLDRGAKSWLPNQVLVRFDHKVVGLESLSMQRDSEHTDPVGDLAAASGYTVEVVSHAISGRLFPREACEAIAHAAGAHAASLKVAPGRNAAPCSDPEALQQVLRRLAPAA